MEAIEKSKTNDPTKLLTGLGIRNVGKNTAKSIMKHFSSIEELMNASYEDLIAIDDIGRCETHEVGYTAADTAVENEYITLHFKRLIG